MKLNYKKRLFLSLCIIFTLFASGIIAIERSLAKKHKKEVLEEKLDAYADIIDCTLQEKNQNQLDSLLQVLPKDIRITLINKQGIVLFDNSFKDLSVLENHADRPEILLAKSNNKGDAIRKSTSNKIEYLYYAKQYNAYFVRVALPYDVKLKHFLAVDNFFLYYIIALFLLMLLFANYISNRFGKSIKQLRDFALAKNKNLFIKDGNSFPNDELGEIGSKIIEDYKHLEENKRTITLEREKLLQHIHSSEEGICFFNTNRKIEYYNGLFMQYLNTIIGYTSIDPSVILSDESFFDIIAFISNSKDTEQKYFQTQLNKQGKQFTIRVNVFEDSSFEIILNDTTKQEKIRQLKQEMTGNIAHELRTPVTSIRGYLETMMEQNLDKEKEHYFLSKAYQQVLALSDIIQDMSLITQIEEAPSTFGLQPITLQSIIDTVKADLDIQLKNKNIIINSSITPDITVKGNERLLYSVFRNLIDNVIHYAGENVKIEIRKYNEDDQFYYISFADNGVGIDEKYLNRLFERFYRTDKGRTRDSGGTGLGLSIVKNALLLHKGSIVVKNRQEGGLEFLFKLQKGYSI